MTSMKRVPTNESGFLRLSFPPSGICLMLAQYVVCLTNCMKEEFEQDIFSLSGYYGGYFFSSIILGVEQIMSFFEIVVSQEDMQLHWQEVKVSRV